MKKILTFLSLLILSLGLWAQAPSYPPAAPYWWSASANAGLDSTTFNSVIELNFITDFGGNPDGMTSNVEAFASFNEYVKIRRKNIKLTIPAGTYILGKQTINEYGYTNISLSGVPPANSPCNTDCNRVKNITITGDELSDCITPTTILKYGKGLKYGAFTNVSATVSTNEPLNAGGTFSSSGKTFATLGILIGLTETENVTIKNLILDGNFYPESLNNMNTFTLPRATANNNTTYQTDKINIGGRWGSGISLSHYGIVMYSNKNIVLENLIIRRFGLDGISYGNTSKIMCPNSIYISNGLSIINCTIDYNGRNGISIASGNNILIKKSRITNTAQGLASPPASGIDFEDDGNGDIGSNTANVIIDSTLIWNNFSGGMFACWGASDMYNVEIKNSDIISYEHFDSYGFNIANRVKNFKFSNCALSGKNYIIGLTAASYISFVNCNFLDRYQIDSCIYEKQIPTGASMSSYFSYYNYFGNVNNISIRDCSFNMFKHAPILLRSVVGSNSIFEDNNLYSTSFGYTSGASDFQYSRLTNIEYNYATATATTLPAKLYPSNGGYGNTITGLTLNNANFPTANPNYTPPSIYILPYDKYYCSLPPTCPTTMGLTSGSELQSMNATLTLSDYEIYPNPAMDVLNIRGDISRINRFSIVQADSKIIKSGKLQSNDINIEHLSPGLYLMTIYLNEKTESFKFIKK